ncbi:ISKra4 family transposase [Leptolyngbya cf. ectocarpi LEGE 11479]|uniref:ISKra4 family transposase n=1 Tax=Leptolyngbya cf. ectocarpi LEGE 11479 TaxID=1828722 RepID=A0A928ZX86_LEPEC|nr:ISKra4 family transposase [Leptolyngbya ectocarpi]MBE9069115.1 ISKra4 family transposase [Leptolyngbya cf. ectocarpi LEGE 11479]
MSAVIVESDASSVTIQITIPFEGSMLASEESIQTQLNAAGVLASGKALEQFDTDGSPLAVGRVVYTSKGRQPKSYQSPYGKVSIDRHVYQSSEGGATFCPLEVDGRIIVTSTPRFAKQISHKYAEMSGPRVVNDLGENHGRQVPRSFVQTLAETVGSIALAQEETWHYQTPKPSEPIATVSIGSDGTCMLMCEDHYREAMVGTISLVDAQGERQHTTYIGANPEYGRERFFKRMTGEIEHSRKLFPDAHYQGLADGAPENWAFLEPLTDTQVLDFYHACQYLKGVAKSRYPRSHRQREAWLAEQCQALKHDTGAADKILAEMQSIDDSKLGKSNREALQAAITYFRNHRHQMNYAEAIAQHLPIGSGVTEAGCKIIVKARLGGAGMKWKDAGAAIVLSLRTLSYTAGRWPQFWAKINQYGFSLAS